jgi:ethanolamine utilization protein EutN
VPLFRAILFSFCFSLCVFLRAFAPSRLSFEVFMQLGTVIGRATATVKHASFVGWKLAIVQPLNIARQPEADPVIAIDKFGSGPGSMVILNSDGNGARETIGKSDSPVRWYIVGIVDE